MRIKTRNNNKLLLLLLNIVNLLGIISDRSSVSNYKDINIDNLQLSDQTNKQISKYIGQTIDDYKLIDKVADLGIPSIHLSDDLRCGDMQLLLPFTVTSIDSTIDSTNPNDLSIQILERVRIIQSQLSNCLANNSYFLNDHIFKGGQGDVWRAYKISMNGFFSHTTTYILKRMHIKDSMNILECALREIYFGKLFNDLNKNDINNNQQHYFNNYPLSVTRFIKYFNDSDDYWLVFHDEGISLQKLLYITTYTSNLAILEPSAMWKKMRTTKSGAQTLKGLIHHLIAAIADLHELDIIHRDIKPSNILINTENDVKLLIGDFSSAINNDVINKGYYGLHGPTTMEETLAYAPPEVLLSIDSDNVIPYDPIYKKSYDVWSIGIVFLEMILGTANVFDVDQRSSSIISKKIKMYYNKYNNRRNKRNKSKTKHPNNFEYENISLPDNHNTLNEDFEEDQPIMNERYLLLIIALVDYCIYEPERQTNDRKEYINQNSLFYNNLITCSIENFQRAILKRDPLGIGYNDKWGLDLLNRLLKFNPKDRISLKEALNHAYFHGPYYSAIDNTEFALYDEVIRYDQMIQSRTFIANKDIDDLPILLNKLPYRESYPLLDLSIPNDESCDSLSWFNRIYDKEMCPELLLPQINIPNQVSKDRTDNDIEVLSIELPIDPLDNITFTCPTCNRTFKGNYLACKTHLEARKHGYRCLYDINHKQLPNCLQDYSIYPYDPHSGWCDLQGRRKYIEDYHSIVFDEDYLFIGVFDGHYGSRGARLASRRIPKLFDAYIKSFEHKYNYGNSFNYNYSKQIDILNSINNHTDWRSLVETINENTVIDSNRNLTSDVIIQSIYQSFIEVDSHLDEYSIIGDVSGTTASIVIIYSDYLLIAHVGDSRIVLCCDNIGLPIVLTVDHTPYDHNEYHDVIRRGGYIDTHFGELLRVNKKLAITRSLGDKQFQDIISNIPDVLLLKKLRSTNSTKIVNDSYCQKYQRHYHLHEPQFVILATDGLWDVLSSDEAVEMVCDYMYNSINDNSLDIMKNAAKILALEAYVRGSSDNIGVCIVDLIESRHSK